MRRPGLEPIVKLKRGCLFVLLKSEIDLFWSPTGPRLCTIQKQDYLNNKSAMSSLGPSIIHFSSFNGEACVPLKVPFHRSIVIVHKLFTD